MTQDSTLKTIHVGIDGNEANVSNRVGSNHYAFGVIWGMYQLHPQDMSFIVYLKHAPLPDMPATTDWWHYKVIRPSFAWTQWRLPLSLYNPIHRPDIFYSPGHYAPRFAPIPTITSVMDLAFLKLPHLFLKFKRGAKQLADWTQYSVQKARAIIVISKHTKQDVIEAYQVDPSRISIAYPGVDQNQYLPTSKNEPANVVKKYQLPPKYILHVGTIQPRKNVTRLIKAFESLPGKYRHYHLVLVGQLGWMADEVLATINASPKQSLIHQIGFVDQQDMPAIMAQAQCLALVGLYEGFGMPPAESLACGTIPVVSNNSSLPEVVGEAGIQVDPYSVASITHGIMVALDLTTEQKILRLANGRQHIAQFTWDKAAQVIIDAIQKVYQTI